MTDYEDRFQFCNDLFEVMKKHGIALSGGRLKSFYDLSQALSSLRFVEAGLLLPEKTYCLVSRFRAIFTNCFLKCGKKLA